MPMNEYRRYAAECVVIADNAVNLDTKLSLLGLAEAWLELARRAEQDELEPRLNQEKGRYSRALDNISGRPSCVH